MKVSGTLRIPVSSAYTFGTKNKLPAVLLVVPSLVVLDRWRPPFGVAILLGVALLALLFLALRSYWSLEVVEGTVPPSDARSGVTRARLYRQLCLGKRVLRSREVDLSPYTWLRTTSVSMQEVTLELGNGSYQTLTLAAVRSRGNSGLMPRKRQAAIRDLCAVGAQVSAMTGITDRGFREMA